MGDGAFWLGLWMPFFGTALGAAAVFCLGREPKGNRELLGFAAGVMLAACVWSLLLPAARMAQEAGGISWLPCLVGLLSGALLMAVLEGWVDSPENATMVAVTLHNIPEGMAVGVALAGGEGALALSLGIALQNIPEGAVISLPLAAAGMGRGRAFHRGVLSGAVEPAASLVTAALVWALRPALPYVLAFAAGAMLYVVARELLPQAGKSRAGALWAAAGFALMMTMDMAL